VPLNSRAKIQQLGPRLVVSHTAQGRERGNWSCTPLFFLHSPVQREEEEEASSKRLLGLKCLRLKRKQDSLGPRSSSTVRRSLQTELTCIYRVHSLSFSHQHVSTTADITEHGRIIYRFYMWTANSECVTHTHTRLWRANSWQKKKVEAASNGTLSHTSKHPFLCPVTLK